LVKLAVSGELDASTAPQLQYALCAEEGSGRAVLLDLSALTFIDSTGIMVLLSAATKAAGDGWDLAIENSLQDGVQRLLRITGIEPRLPLVEPLVEG
jgi:anti-sigma B factor antagonist